MRKFYLSLKEVKSPDPLNKTFDKKYSVEFTPFQFSPSVRNNLSRRSPIFSLVDIEESFDPFDEGDGSILFLYVTEPFQTLGRLDHEIKDYSLKQSIFLSHGLASIILFVKSTEEKEYFLKLINDYLLFFEEWKIKKFQIDDCICPQLSNEEHNLSLFEIEYDKIDIEIQDILNKLFASLNFAYKSAMQFMPFYKELLCWFNLSTHIIVLKYCFLNDIIGEAFYRQTISQMMPNCNANEVDNDVETIKNIRADESHKIIRIHQIKDDLIQISAITQTFYQQAFSGVSPIVTNSYEPGEYSLLGIGGVFLSLFSLYAQARGIFRNVADVRQIINLFKKMASPPIPDISGDFSDWAQLLDSNDGIESTIPEASKDDIAFHYVYFSNRLGFRETKHSLSVAIQTISLLALPPWNLCTFFHEFSHAHLRALFSYMYPTVCQNNNEQFDKIYEIYSNRSNQMQTKNLFDFFQFIILSTASDLYELEIRDDKVRKYLPKSQVVKALRKKHHQLNELLVHILDFNYFYDADTNAYIKSIWASWLELPFILSRTEEYLLRTICAIATIIDGDENTVFEKAVKKIKKALEELKESKFLNKEPLSFVLEKFDQPRNLKMSFFQLFCYVKATSKLLISPTIKEKITDSNAALQEDDSYSMEIPPDSFYERKIESPINFLFEYYKNIYNNNLDVDRSDNSEFTALWLFFALRSNG